MNNSIETRRNPGKDACAQKHGLLDSIRHNHMSIMLICCLVPIVMGISVYFFGISNNYMTWMILLLCLLIHFFMMKDMHKS